MFIHNSTSSYEHHSHVKQYNDCFAPADNHCNPFIFADYMQTFYMVGCTTRYSLDAVLQPHLFDTVNLISYDYNDRDVTPSTKKLALLSNKSEEPQMMIQSSMIG